MSLQERVAVVTGGGRGIGAATARCLAREGASLGIFDVREDAAEALAAAIRADGGDAFAVRCDVADERQVEAAIDAVVQRYGSLHVLVNNAGISPSERQPIDEISLELWDHVLRVNLGGCFLCCKHAVRVMKAGGRGGAIVNLASVAGITGVPFVQPYSASKHGVVGLTKTLAMELAEFGIRVNAVAPGMTDTEMIRGGAPAPAAGTVAAMARYTPLGRFGRAEEIAEAITFLASDAASYITGVAMPVDGGSVAGRKPVKD